MVVSKRGDAGFNYVLWTTNSTRDWTVTNDKTLHKSGRAMELWMEPFIWRTKWSENLIQIMTLYIVSNIAMNNVQFVYVVRKIEKTLNETAVVL